MLQAGPAGGHGRVGGPGGEQLARARGRGRALRPGAGTCLEVDPPDRPDLCVLARFLDRLAGAGSEHSRSSLQRATRTNDDVFRSYLALLQRRAGPSGSPARGAARTGSTCPARAVRPTRT